MSAGSCVRACVLDGKLCEFLSSCTSIHCNTELVTDSACFVSYITKIKLIYNYGDGEE
jgi:hypothetical protein